MKILDLIFSSNFSLAFSDLAQPSLRLLFAAILGGLIGWERERHDRPAGLRTHMLVCVGSALITVISTHFTKSVGSDPTRIMSNIVTGIGFLGAGTIMRQGSIIRGLTTAASLWIVSAVGMAAGIGGKFSVIALLSTVIIFLTLTTVNQLEGTLLAKRQYRDLIIGLTPGTYTLENLLSLFDDNKILVKSIIREPADVEGPRVIHFSLRLPAGLRVESATRELSRISEITRIEWE